MFSPKEVPIINDDNRPFWEGARRGVLLFQRCAACARLRHPPRVICPRCLSEEFSFEEADGAGTVYSFTVIHRTYLPDRLGKTPYVAAVINLDCGVRMVSNIVDTNPDEVEIGMEVRVVFREITDGLVLPLFVPAKGVAA
jgi:uncharacterized OB-fold protein